MRFFIPLLILYCNHDDTVETQNFASLQKNILVTLNVIWNKQEGSVAVFYPLLILYCNYDDTVETQNFASLQKTFLSP